MFDDDYDVDDEECYLEEKYYKLQEKREQLLSKLSYYKEINEDPRWIASVQNELDQINQELNNLDF